MINNNQFTTAVVNSSSLVPFIAFPLIWELNCLNTQETISPSTIVVRSARAYLAGKGQQCFSLIWALSHQWPSHVGYNPAVGPRSPASSNCMSGQELGHSSFLIPTIAIGGPPFATTAAKKSSVCFNNSFGKRRGLQNELGSYTTKQLKSNCRLWSWSMYSFMYFSFIISR